jgi:nucleotide-binding universal stress UspA family protein
MNERMKVMIGYDGSTHADAAIDDMRLAGLGPETDVKIVSIVKQQEAAPSISELDLISLVSGRVEAALSRSAEHRTRVIAAARDLAAHAAERVRLRFPYWDVSADAIEGDPADELLQMAKVWRPDLIVVGSQGRSALGRFFLGSVSKRIADEAKTSVRVVRRGFNDINPPTVVAGASKLRDAERLIHVIGQRSWPDGTKLKLVAVDDGVAAGRVSALYPYAADIFAQYAEPLGVIGIDVSVDVLRGETASLLLDAAEHNNADTIFVVASSDSESAFGMDETASVLVTDATCTVEIVR